MNRTATPDPISNGIAMQGILSASKVLKVKRNLFGNVIPV